MKYRDRLRLYVDEYEMQGCSVTKGSFYNGGLVLEILLKNIQSIKEATFEFPDVGLVQLTGNNSNGKSILIKVIAAIVTLKILDNEERRSLIWDKADSGYVALRYKDKVLVVFLHEERNKCSVTLHRANSEKIIRQFREGGIAELLNEFGFCIYNKNTVCLQIHETFGAIPFISTTKAVNYEIVDSVTTDTVAQNFMCNFKEITHKSAKDKLKLIDEKIDNINRLKSSMVLFDYKAYEGFYKRIEKIYTVLKYCNVLILNWIRIPPKVEFIDIIPPNLKKMSFKSPIPNMNYLKDITKELNALKEVSTGKCPVCGKLFKHTCGGLEV